MNPFTTHRIECSRSTTPGTIRIRRMPIVLAVAALFGGSADALADDVTTSTGDAQQMGAITVKSQREVTEVPQQASSGTKIDTPLTETPQSISVITADDIAAHGADSMMEALRYAPGAAVETYGPDPRGYDWVKLRGFDTFDSQYRDGMRIFDYMFMESYGLDRLEVLRGPSSALYGQAVPGGLINGVSKLPLPAPQREVEFSGGNCGSLAGNFDLTGPVLDSDSVDYRLAGLARSGGNQTHYPDGSEIPSNRQYIEPAITWRPARDTRITLLGDYMHNVGQFADFAVAPDGSLTEVLIDVPGFDTDTSTTWSAGWQVDQGFLDGRLVFHHRLRKMGYSEDNRYINMGTYDSKNNPTLLGRTATIDGNDARVWTTDNSLEWKTATGPLSHTLLGGIDYGSNDHNERDLDGPAPSINIAHPSYNHPVTTPTDFDYGFHEHNTQIGIYTQDQVHWSDWLLTASMRRDWARNHNDDLVEAGNTVQNQAAYSGRAGLTWKTSSGIAPYASWSQSFQPNSGEDKSGNVFDPTIGRQVEIGAKYATADESALYTISAFRLTQDNVVTADPANQGFYVETGQIRSQGIEAEGKGRLTRTLDLSASYTWNPVKVTQSGDPTELNKVPILTPRQNASLWLSHTTREGLLNNLKLSAGARYLGSTWGDTANTPPNYNHSMTLCDLALRYPRGHWELGANLNNLFDRNMFIATPYGFYVTARRTINASLRYEW